MGEYPMVIFNPEIKKNGSRLSVFQSKHTIGSTLWSISTQKLKKRKQIVRFSVKTYHREYPLVIFNPEIKINGSRLSVFQSKHTIGSTLWPMSTQKLKKTEADCPIFSQNIPKGVPYGHFQPRN